MHNTFDEIRHIIRLLELRTRTDYDDSWHLINQIIILKKKLVETRPVFMVPQSAHWSLNIHFSGRISYGFEL